MMRYELDRIVSHPRLGLGRSVPRSTAEYEAGVVVHPRLGFGRSVARETPLGVHHSGSGIGAFNEGVRVTAEMWSTVQSWIGGGGGTPVTPGSRPTVRMGSRG